jgi:tetratricopeptide (TPR) repeat protein
MLDRRVFMKLVGPVLVGLAEDWLDIEPPELVAVLRGGRVTEDFVARMEEGLPRLRLLEAERGGDRARRLIDAELGMVAEVLGRSTYTSAVSRRLHALAAELGRMAGWASFDSGSHAAAQRYWVAALHSAHASDDRAIGANVLKSMSLQCYDFNLPKEALLLARRAHEGAGAVTPRTDAMLSLREARAHAALGDRIACEHVLFEADTFFGRADQHSNDPTWVGYFDAAEFHAQVGTCYLDLDRHAEADRHFAAALELFPETKVRDHATYIIRRASAQVGLGDLDQATALLGAAIPLIRQAPSDRNIQRADSARRRIPLPRTDQRVTELDEQMATLVA